MSSKYGRDVDLLHPNNSHAMAVARVPARSEVLDLGVADGSVARVLTAIGCHVWGVEADEEAAAEAAQICNDVVVADIETVNLNDAFDGRRFDVVLCLDILEHLKDPVAVLSQVKKLLEPRGWVILSIPNVAHGDVRLQPLEGPFNFNDLGLLDRTHLRFFDREGVVDLVAGAGMSILDLDRVRLAVGGTEIAVDASDPVVAERLAADPETETYQFVIMAVPSESPLLADPPVLMARDLQRRLLEVQAESEMNLAALQAASEEREMILRTLLVELRAGADSVRASWTEH
jgi:O-antigen biosynthesis protein